MSKEEIHLYLERAKQDLRAVEISIQNDLYHVAVSRAYYTMFYVAEALLASRGEAYSSHSAVISAFGRVFAKTGKLDAKFHRWLIDAQDLRNVGDYGVGRTITSEQVKEVITQAQEFIAAGRANLISNRRTEDE